MIQHSLSRFLRGLSAVLLAALGLALPVGASETLYATGVGGAGGLSGLYTIDLATGEATLAWYLPGVHLYGGGLAYDAGSDTLYATGVLDSDTGTSRLFTIDRHTGAVTYFPGMSPTINVSQGGLALNPLTGVLYAVGGAGFQSTTLFTIDKTTGAATAVGQNGGNCCTSPFGFNMYGLGFRADGTLFANGITFTNVPASDSHLYTLDLASGLATDLGPHGVSAGTQLTQGGLAFSASGVCYSMGSLSPSANGLYGVDPSTALATVIGDFILHIGAAGGLAFVPDGLPWTYCTSKTNSQGCVPAIGSSGLPSATSAAPFLIHATNVVNQKPGLLIYGYSQSIALFQGGYLCMSNPTRRVTTSGSHGAALPAADCSGSYSIDFNARIQSGIDSLLLPGQEIDAQYWSRDPASAIPVGLTNAISFQIAP